jgi:hypothetical protein
MYAWLTFGGQEAGICQAQIADSQAVFTAPQFIYNRSHISQGGFSKRIDYGKHSLPIHQAQAISGSVLFPAWPYPPISLLGITRDISITQEEWPLNAPSFFFPRTAYLTSVSATAPPRRPVIQTLPQEYREEGWSHIFALPPAILVQYTPPPVTARSVPIVPTRPQEPGPLQWNASAAYTGVALQGLGVVVLQAPVSLTLQEVRSPTGQWTGSIVLSWSASPGLSRYQVYVFQAFVAVPGGMLPDLYYPNGPGRPYFLQDPPTIISGLIAQASGFMLDVDYIFAVVGLAAGQPATPVSNYIEYRHQSSAEFSTVTKYPWGDTFETGYIKIIPLGTPQ